MNEVLEYKYSLQDLFNCMSISDIPRRKEIKRLVSRGLISPKALKLYGLLKHQIILQAAE